MAHVVTSWETVYFNSPDFAGTMSTVADLGNKGFEVKGFSSEICPDSENRWNAFYNVVMQRPSSWTEDRRIKYPD